MNPTAQEYQQMADEIQALTERLKCMQESPTVDPLSILNIHKKLAKCHQLTAAYLATVVLNEALATPDGGESVDNS